MIVRQIFQWDQRCYYQCFTGLYTSFRYEGKSTHGVTQSILNCFQRTYMWEGRNGSIDWAIQAYRCLISTLSINALTTTSSLTVSLKDMFEIQVKCINIIALVVLQTLNQCQSLLPRLVITEKHVIFHILFQVRPKPCGFAVLYSHLLSCQRFVHWCPLVYGTSRHLFHLQMLLSTAHLPSKKLNYELFNVKRVKPVF